jgi:phytoene dehydrogenase-like protein
MKPEFDIIVIGGGHNGLVAAAWLAKAGRRVLVLERRETLGGVASTEELIPGYQFNIGAPDAGMLLPQVIDALDLKRHGLEFIENPVATFDPVTGLTLWRDIEKTQQELSKLSPKDADAWPKYLKQTERFANILAQMAGLQPFALKGSPLGLLLSWAQIALRVRGLGGKDPSSPRSGSLGIGMMEFLRVLPMSAYQFLNERFESAALKGLLSSVALTGLMQGPRAAGTAFMLLYQQIGGPNGGYRSSRTIRGGLGQLITALAKAAQAAGAEIRTGAAVQSLLTENGRVAGVRLSDGGTIRVKAVLSSADPRTTFLDVLSAPELSLRFSRRFRNLKFQGSTASVHLALSGLPDFPSANGETQRLSGSIVICPSIDYAEQAHDDAKYGRFSEKPILEIRIPSLLDPSLALTGKHTMSIIFRFAPYRLRESDWDSQRERLGDVAVSTLAKYAPDIQALVTDRRVITPLDYEKEYGLAEGSISHGQMGLDQLLLMRPVPGFVGYRSPVAGLYLCGAGAHPGSGVSGAPGLSAAKQAHKELR